MNELAEIFNETFNGFAKIISFPVRLLYWVCKNILSIIGVINNE